MKKPPNLIKTKEEKSKSIVNKKPLILKGN